MTDLLDLAVAAQGGLERFSQFSFVEAKLHQGGVLWALKGEPTVLEDCNVKVDLTREQVSHWPFAPTQNRSVFA